MRLRIHFASPLPSLQPARWFLLGLCEDAGVLLLAAAAAAAFARGRIAGLVARAFGAFVLVWCLCAFLLGEAIVYFGHPPRAEDLRIAASESFWRFSIGPAELARAGAAVGAVLLLLAAAAHLAGRGRPAAVPPGGSRPSERPRLRSLSCPSRSTSRRPRATRRSPPRRFPARSRRPAPPAALARPFRRCRFPRFARSPATLRAAGSSIPCTLSRTARRRGPPPLRGFRRGCAPTSSFS